MSITAESILKSITVGGPVQFHRSRLQAICAAITQSSHISLVLDQVAKDPRFQRATRKILAFRTEEEEGFDDCGEIGAGEKLLHMLEKMGVENILLVLCVWDDGITGGSGIHAALAERARDVLNIVREQVMSKAAPSSQKKQPQLLSPQLPDPNQSVRQDRATYRPSHFRSNVPAASRSETSPDPIITQEDYFDGLSKIEKALQMLNVQELQQLRMPPHHPLVLRVLQAVALLRGARVPTWSAVKEFLESRTLKIELTFLDIGKLRKSQVRLAREVLTKPPRVRIEVVMQTSVQAANLLSWVEGVFAVFYGRKYFKPTGEEIKPEANLIPVPLEEPEASDTVEDAAEQLDKMLTAAQNLEAPHAKKKLDPEIEQKLNQARKLEKDQEERIERLLSLRLEDINFSEKATGLGEELVREMSQTTISEQPTAVLLSLVAKLKEKREAYMAS